MFFIKYELNLVLIIIIIMVNLVKNSMFFKLFFIKILFIRYIVSVIIIIFKDIVNGVLKFIIGVIINDSGIIIFIFKSFFNIKNVVFL